MLLSKQRVVVGVKRARLTYLEPNALFDLYDAAKEVEERRLPGRMIEAGCALGGSSIVLAKAKSRERPLVVYDVFGMIPPPGDADGPDVLDRYRTIAAGESEGLGPDGYYGYETDLLAKVEQNFERFRVSPARNKVDLVKGLYEETLHPQGDVSLAHVDCDWYDSVKVCLERIDPHLVPGGRMIIDDYDSWSGCKQAVDEFLSARTDSYSTERRARLHLVKR